MGAIVWRASTRNEARSERAARPRGLKLTVIGAFAAALLSATGAFAESEPIVVANDPGGDVIAYVRGWEYIATLESPIEIRGYCVSACTLVLGLVPADRVCVGEDAYFGFHSVSINYHGHTAEGTRYLWSYYPPHVQEEIRNKGWDGGAGKRSSGMFLVDGTTFFPLCEAP
jgi:hypothetical protein